MKKIAIIAPYHNDMWGKIEFMSRENLSIAYIASYMETKGYTVDMINAHAKSWDNSTVVEYLSKNQYELIGISCTSQKVYLKSKELIRLIREKFSDVHITMGGIFASMEFENILWDIPQLNTIIKGEGEISFHKLAESIRQKSDDFSFIDGISYIVNGKCISVKEKRIKNLSELPFPKREDLDFANIQEKFLRILAGRGCYGKCAFCSLRRNYGSTGKIYREPQEVVDEIEELIVRYNIDFFTFFDDIFYDTSPRGRRWVEEFVIEVKKRNISFTFRIELRVNDVTEKEISALKEIGLNSVYLGVETGVPRLLKEMRKGATVDDARKAILLLRKYDIKVLLGYITIIPTMSYQELKENYKFLFEIGDFTEANVYNRLNIYNGCEYEDILKTQGLLLPKENFWERHNYSYMDKKVELFVDQIMGVRELFIPLRRTLNNFKKLCIINDSLDEYQQCEKLNIKTWIKIINILFDLIDEKYYLESDILPRNIYTEILHLEKVCNEIIDSCTD